MNYLPLIVKGARQIGKTESINEFSKTYKNVVYINFALEPIYKKIVNGGYDVICRGALFGINYKKKFIWAFCLLQKLEKNLSFWSEYSIIANRKI